MIVISQLFAGPMKRVVQKSSNITHVERMKLSLGIIGHTINHFSLIIGAIVINEHSIALEKTIGKFSYHHRSILLNEHTEIVGLI
jgi:hypothetical protein